jgi:hypothetical protein
VSVSAAFTDLSELKAIGEEVSEVAQSALRGGATPREPVCLTSLLRLFLLFHALEILNLRGLFDRTRC